MRDNHIPLSGEGAHAREEKKVREKRTWRFPSERTTVTSAAIAQLTSTPAHAGSRAWLPPSGRGRLRSAFDVGDDGAKDAAAVVGRRADDEAGGLLFALRAAGSERAVVEGFDGGAAVAFEDSTE